MARNVLPLQSVCPFRMRLTVGWDVPIAVAIFGSLQPDKSFISLNRVVMFFSIAEGYTRMDSSAIPK